MNETELEYYAGNGKVCVPAFPGDLVVWCDVYLEQQVARINTKGAG